MSYSCSDFSDDVVRELTNAKILTNEDLKEIEELPRDEMCWDFGYIVCNAIRRMNHEQR